jgi:hypothetical protein
LKLNLTLRASKTAGLGNCIHALMTELAFTTTKRLTSSRISGVVSQGLSKLRQDSQISNLKLMRKSNSELVTSYGIKMKM